MPTFVLADRHPIVRHGLKVVLESRAGWTVVGEASNAPETLALLGSLQPDVLILDILLELDGSEVVQHAKEQSPQTRLLIFSMQASDASVRATLNRGAMAYVLKEAEADEILHAVGEVLEGRRYLSHALIERAIDMYLQQPDTGHDTAHLRDAWRAVNDEGPGTDDE
jgi:DNA-binding NarL/FixJ family response regulator